MADDLTDDAPDPSEASHQQVDPLALVGTAVDLALGVVALGVDVLRQAPDRAAELAATLPARAQQEYEALLVRGSALRSNLGGLLVGRLLGPPIVEDEPAEVDPFDLLLSEDEVDLDDDLPAEPPRTPLVVVPPATPRTDDVSSSSTVEPPSSSNDPAGAPADEGPSAATSDAPGALPLEGFDEMTIGTLRVTARQLGIAELEILLAHERGHGRRDGVLSLLETRIAQLQQEQSAG
jgi:hypothetical protein